MTGENQRTGKRSVPLSLLPPKFPYRLAWNRSQVSTVTARLLTRLNLGPAHYLFYTWPACTDRRTVSTIDIIYIYIYIYIYKSKSVPLQAWSGPEDSRKLRFPDFMTTAQGGGKIVSLTHRSHLPPRNPLGLISVRG